MINPEHAPKTVDDTVEAALAKVVIEIPPEDPDNVKKRDGIGSEVIGDYRYGGWDVSPINFNGADTHHKVVRRKRS